MKDLWLVSVQNTNYKIFSKTHVSYMVQFALPVWNVPSKGGKNTYNI